MKILRNLPKVAYISCFVFAGSCREKSSVPDIKRSSSNRPSGEPIIFSRSKEIEKDTLPQSIAERQLNEQTQEKNNNVTNELEAIEKARVFLFSVPLADTAVKKRQEIWDHLNPSPFGLTADQYKYACDFLDQNTNATPLEKLTFWKICNTRIIYQKPGGVVRNLGGMGVIYEMTHEKMKAILYSALGKKSEIVTYDEAVSEGIEILKKSVAPLDNRK